MFEYNLQLFDKTNREREGREGKGRQKKDKGEGWVGDKGDNEIIGTYDCIRTIITITLY